MGMNTWCLLLPIVLWSSAFGSKPRASWFWRTAPVLELSFTCATSNFRLLNRTIPNNRNQYGPPQFSFSLLFPNLNNKIAYLLTFQNLTNSTLYKLYLFTELKRCRVRVSPDLVSGLAAKKGFEKNSIHSMFFFKNVSRFLNFRSQFSKKFCLSRRKSIQFWMKKWLNCLFVFVFWKNIF